MQLGQSQRWWLLCVLAASLSTVSHGQPCSNFCSGNGICELSQCTCFAGYTGGDCSQRSCPMDVAWNDEATGEDTAHNLAECSNRGTCDRESGQCTCDLLFSGRACQHSECPNDCWGRGRCVNMKYNALYKDPGEGTVYSYTDVWDAEKIYGCLCDQGFTGYDCSLRECPKGDDPLTVSQDDEVQLLKCSATSGSFTLTMGGHTTEPIPYNTFLSEFEELLEATPGFGEVTVVFSESGVPVCSTGFDQVASITFLAQFGDLPDLVVHSVHAADCNDPNDLCGGTGIQLAFDGAALSSSSLGTLYSVTGSKENEYCSRRGACDESTGICTCYTKFVTSDGRGAEGDRGDCGYESATVQACPGLISCSGHGVCSQASEYKCTCSVGWESGDCSVRTCPLGKSWFDEPIADQRAHQLAECSNMGTCDSTTGECRCHTGFEGAACSQMSCPGVVTECSGHGQCLSMAQLANMATLNGNEAATTYGQVPNDPYRFDYDMIYGCLCDEGFEGHDCSLMSCPTGDDPETGVMAVDRQYHETQALRCEGDGGSVKLTFRTYTSSAIDFDATADELKAALVELDSITDVDVDFSSGASLCTVDASNVVTVTFTQELGDVPPLTGFFQSNGVSLTHGSGTPALDIIADGGTLGSVTTQQGTMENIECSGRGLCIYETGKCNCFDGFGSSNGSNQAGERGDCGWKIPWATESSDSEES